MGKNKGNIISLPDIAGIIGIVMIIAGGVMLKLMPDGYERIFYILILSGLVLLVSSILIISIMTKAVYVCPECRARFYMPKGELTLTTGRYARAALLTCPECRKTNLCRRKRILKSNKK